jgi:hypothetical protein
MRAKEIQAEFHICEGCDKGGRDERTEIVIRPGAVNVVEGWKDADDDWIGSKEEFPTLEEALEESYLEDEGNIYETSYLECPNGHDSDDGWEIEAFDKIYVCGVCHVRYTSLRDAAACCENEENI